MRQKTQEKIEEKHKKRVEKIKATKRNELDNLNSSINNQSPTPTQNELDNLKSDKSRLIFLFSILKLIEIILILIL